MPKILDDLLGTFGVGTTQRIGLACSGGGARGFSHVGVIMALEKAGKKPEILSGVSAGAIAASLYGAGLSPAEMLECFAEYSHMKDFTEWTVPKEGFFRLTKFARMLESWLPVKMIEEMQIPTVICATDFDNGKSVGWAKGEIVPRVVASCSIPILFTPVKIAGVNYVDGGVLRNLPAWAIRSRCSKLIGANCSPLGRDYKFKSSIVDIALRSYQLMAKSNTLQDLNLCDYVVQTPALARFSTFDMASMHKIVVAGYDAASRVLEKANL